MKIAILDITARNAVQYNPSLCKELAKIADNKVVLLAPKLSEEALGYQFKSLIRIVPNNWESSSGRLKRILRALEVFLNYVLVFFYIVCKRPDILHIQWLPFLEFSSLEVGVLRVLKFFDRKTKLVFTAHNIYPHDIVSEKGRQAYKKRFIAISRYLDAYIVHLNGAKKELAKEFNISENKIFVAYHGIYVGKTSNIGALRNADDKIRIIMYGYQTIYKGADLLIEAIQALSPDQRGNFEVTIVGKTDDKLYKSYSGHAETLGIKWINKFVTDKELYSLIDSSDLILLPYREISQSGVLLLALSYRKPILTSDLPSFKETLEGYDDSCFFHAGNSNSLAEMLMRFSKGDIDDGKLKEVIEKLNEKYSWRNTALSTAAAYENVL